MDMNITTQEHSVSIQNTRKCINAKPPINHSAKHADSAGIGDDVTAFLARGGVIEPVQNYGRAAKAMTYKEKNRSTYIKEVV
jgi:hypothetical protein